jgi:hypothetical protein
METNADENMVFSSLKGPFYYSVLAFIILLGAIVIFLAVRHYSGIWTLLLALIGTMFFLSAALLMRFVGKIRYVLETDGIKLNDSMTTRHSMISVFTPYIKIIEFYKARNVLIGYGASTDCVVIRFINKYGNKDTLALSPKNKQLFISELTKRTGIPVSPNPRSKTKGRNA